MPITLGTEVSMGFDSFVRPEDAQFAPEFLQIDALGNDRVAVQVDDEVSTNVARDALAAGDPELFEIICQTAIDPFDQRSGCDRLRVVGIR